MTGVPTCTVALCGDVMLGRGVDQVLAHPGDPALREQYLRDARDYVRLVERRRGPLRAPVDDAWPWGDALPVLRERADVRVINLETSVTRSDDFAPGKGVHYRMNPANIGAVAVAGPDVCVLANNHVLDFGRAGLRETLATLSGAGLPVAGAGPDGSSAASPLAVAALPGTRLLVLACGTGSSGVPAGWAAGPSRAGVNLVELSDAVADELAGRLAAQRRAGDIAVVSVHWGSNWGYEVSPDQQRFAHRLVEGGVDIVHGHSSHHPRPIEVYRGRLVLYGCGDFIDDYEGISGHERFRDDLRLLYLATVAVDSGALVGLRALPLESVRMRLRHAQRDDRDWLRARLDEVSRPFGTRVSLDDAGRLVVSPA